MKAEANRPDVAALSHEVGAIMRRVPAGDETRFLAMDLCQRLLEGTDYYNALHDHTMVDTFRRWIVRVQERFVNCEPVQLTQAQARALKRIMDEPTGVLEYRGQAGLGKSSWERMMNRLCVMGLAVPYVHGGFEITEAGRFFSSQS